MKKTLTKKLLAALAGTPFALAAGAGENAEKIMEDETIPFAPKFPLGAPNDAYARFFSGSSWVARLTRRRSPSAVFSRSRSTRPSPARAAARRQRRVARGKEMTRALNSDEAED